MRRNDPMTAMLDLTGRRFGRLLVLGRSPRRNPSRTVMWRCVCDCGKEAHVGTQSLRDGRTSSCGCLRAELARERAKKGAAASADKAERTRIIDAVLGLAKHREPDRTPRKWTKAQEALAELERAWR